MVVKKSGGCKVKKRGMYDVSLTPNIPYTQQIPYKIFVKLTIIIKPMTMTITRISSNRVPLKQAFLLILPKCSDPTRKARELT